MGPGECGRANMPRSWWQGGDVVDGRRLEVIVDGLPLHSGAQLAVDTTLVCALYRDGTPVDRAAQQDGVVLQSARRRKERTYPELLGRRARSKLDVLVVEVGGRWSEETSCLCWPEPRFVARIHCCVSGCSKLGVSGGVHCCPAPPLAQSRPQCWSCREHVVPMGTLQLSTMWSRISASPGWWSEPDRVGFCHTLHFC